MMRPMCGIGGVFNLDSEGPPPERELLGRMAASLHHRGPDERGFYRDRRVGLAHTRLSIVDLQSGQQPLSVDEGRLWIAYNGEIYNHVELRDELREEGWAFHTASDTEVVATAWCAWGPRALDRFNGQWAFALYDRERGELVLSRDRFGIRPLFYAEHRGRLLFASEIKALFAAEPALSQGFDPVGMDEALTFWSPQAPHTAFSGVAQLEPGHLRIVKPGQVVDRAYWRPTTPARSTG
ncbi:MAG TPA: hypothetical protein ENK57_14150 [Polyangiaceae bacterium]|nr:hypothetical protein [Polyangiaceae bacterium]